MINHDKMDGRALEILDIWFDSDLQLGTNWSFCRISKKFYLEEEGRGVRYVHLPHDPLPTFSCSTTVFHPRWSRESFGFPVLVRQSLYGASQGLLHPSIRNWYWNASIYFATAYSCSDVYTRWREKQLPETRWQNRFPVLEECSLIWEGGQNLPRDKCSFYRECCHVLTVLSWMQSSPIRITSRKTFYRVGTFTTTWSKYSVWREENFAPYVLGRLGRNASLITRHHQLADDSEWSLCRQKVFRGGSAIIRNNAFGVGAWRRSIEHTFFSLTDRIPAVWAYWRLHGTYVERNIHSPGNQFCCRTRGSTNVLACCTANVAMGDLKSTGQCFIFLVALFKNQLKVKIRLERAASSNDMLKCEKKLYDWCKWMV